LFNSTGFAAQDQNETPGEVITLRLASSPGLGNVCTPELTSPSLSAL